MRWDHLERAERRLAVFFARYVPGTEDGEGGGDEGTAVCLDMV
jgi:hypothetical protein